MQAGSRREQRGLAATKIGILGRGSIGCEDREVSVAVNGSWFLVEASGGDDIAERRQVGVGICK